MLSDFVSLFFPRYCMACNNILVKGEEVICLRCDYELPQTGSHKDPANFIAIKFYGKVQLTDAVACYRFSKEGSIQRLLHRLKYANKPVIGEYLGKKYGTELAESGFTDKYDLIVPVPLHRTRERRRGYNQSAVFATGLSEVLGIPCEHRLLVRTKKTTTQTRKSRTERWQNVENIFEVIHPGKITGKRVLIVDDVITTGATLESCALSLLKAGCASAGVAALAAAR